MLAASVTLSPLLLFTATAAAPLVILFQRDASAHSPPCRVLGTAVLARPRLFGLGCRSAVWRYGRSEAQRRTRRSAARSTPRCGHSPSSSSKGTY